MNREFEIFSKMSNQSIRNKIDIDSYCKLYDELGLDIVMDRTKAAKMFPFIACASVKANRDAAVWRPIYEEYRLRNQKIAEGVDFIYKELKKNGVKKIFLSENFGALLSSCGDIALFAAGDVDNCADISESNLISDTLKSLGFSEKRRYAGKQYISAEYSNADILPEGFEFGVQWEPLARLTLPSFVHLNNFVDWGRLRQYKDTSINLPPTDALMYICLLHISLHSFCRAPSVRLYRDLVNCSVGITDSDWERVLAWAGHDKTISRLTTAAYVGNRIAKLVIPDEVFNHLDKKLIDTVFDENLAILKGEPGRLKVFSIEIQCSDHSIGGGVKDILFPDKEWMKQVYGNSNILSVVKHIASIL